MFADKVDHFISRLCEKIAWVYAILIVVILTQVILRKGLNSGLILLEELQWHLYAVGVMFGMAYALVHDAHVRVDIFHARFEENTKQLIEVLGILFLLLPFLGIIFYHSLDFVADAWRINERSTAPAGLPYRWLIKSVIPVSVGLLILSALNRAYRSLTIIFSTHR